jgi:hypothetical protein
MGGDGTEIYGISNTLTWIRVASPKDIVFPFNLKPSSI